MTRASEAKAPSLAEAFEPAKDVSGLTNVPVRVLLLAVLILLVNSWFTTHLGVELKTLLMIEAIAGVVTILRKPLGKDDSKAIDMALRRIVEFLLGTRFLMAAFAIFLIGASLISSVTVLAAGVEQIGTIRFCAEGDEQCSEKQLRGGDRSVRFVHLTSPFGRSFYVDALGFRRHSFQLYPWIPTVIRASTDLQRSPALLFRVEYPHFDLVGGKIRIVDADSGKEIASGDTDAESASLLVGPDVQIPETLAARWTRQLAAADHPAAAHAKPMEAWFNAHRPGQTVTLTPGQRIDAYFFDRGHAGQPAAFNDYAAVAKGVTVSGGSLQDVVLKRRK